MKSLLLFMFIGAACAQVAFINDAIGDFSIRLLKKTSCSNGGNSVHSAYSISTALGMCLLGSRGETYANMKDILGLGAVNKSDIQDGFSDSITELTPFAQPQDSPKSFVLSVANRLFVNESFQLSNSYLRRMSNIFHASAVPVDFTNEGPSVQENINAFVSNKTRKLIPKLLDQPLPPTTLMTLVNALYFKGTWEKKFKEQPSAERFNAYENGSNQTAEWVGLTKGFKYAQSETLRAQLVEVPYVTRLSSPLRTSMVFILPDESPNLGIGEWLRGDDFSWKNIAAAIDSTKREIVDLTFPKFKLESKFSLRKALMDLGMREPFTARADFSGMVNGTASNLFLDDVLHKAKMDVDEYGTEAAAATAVSVMFMSMPIPNKPAVKLTINRSFIAMIILRHEESIVPLFTAVVDKL